jgi:hypothetical protein
MAGLLGACSSDGNILPKRERFTPSLVDAAGTQDVGPEVEPDVGSDTPKVRDPNANCVKPGTPNNERGIGGYCESGPRDCQYEGGPRFCTADFRDIATVPDDQWFCSTVCTMDEECGTGAYCFANEFSNGCVPTVCGPDGGRPPG